MTTNLRRALVTGLVVLLPASVHATSPWLPAGGEHQASLSYILQEADTFYPGSAEAALPADLELQTFQVDYAYGINERLAIDVRVG